MNKLTSNDLSVGKAYWIEDSLEPKRIVILKLKREESIGKVEVVEVNEGCISTYEDFFESKNDCINYMIQYNKDQSEMQIEVLESMKENTTIDYKDLRSTHHDH